MERAGSRQDDLGRGKILRHLLMAAAMTAGTLSQAGAAPLCDDLGFAGLLASCNRGEPIALTLAAGQPLG